MLLLLVVVIVMVVVVVIVDGDSGSGNGRGSGGGGAAVEYSHGLQAMITLFSYLAVDISTWKTTKLQLSGVVYCVIHTGSLLVLYGVNTHHRPQCGTPLGAHREFQKKDQPHRT